MTEPRHKVFQYRDGTFDVWRADGALMAADLTELEAIARAAQLNEEGKDND